MSKRRILITGGTGQVGTELLRCHWPEDIELVAPARQELDLCDCDRIKSYIAAGSFSAVINSGAYTAVDRAESDILTAWKVNAMAPVAIAAATKDSGVPIIHISTDYVFSGAKNSPYLEEDPVAPLGVYGASKEAGEQAVRTGNPRHVILRTAWVYSEHGSNFVKTMLRLAKTVPGIKVVGDQIGSPTSAVDIAKTVQKITLSLINHDAAPTGTYHFTNAGEASWFDFASEIFRLRGSLRDTSPVLEEIRTFEYPTAAKRPANSTLSHEKIEADYGVNPRHWKDALSDVMASLRASEVLREDER
ncbi:dTDP-4-dehydrorhamnose reductase [Ensifer adhaerens]|uniref:dTDP-4-dehydrorhamnose reductase n=1 Tax=Ensifer adhaerens TaxID=106592 RepID=UPI003F87B324